MSLAHKLISIKRGAGFLSPGVHHDAGLAHLGFAGRSLWAQADDGAGHFQRRVRHLADGFVASAEQLVILRAVQGPITGTLAASNALVAAAVPRQRIGYAMGLLQVSLGVGLAVGHKRILVGSMFMAGLLYLPQSLATEAWQLLILMALVGVAMGGVIPSISSALPIIC
ncbi:MAG: hypothetical protein ACE5M4_04285 [Anaerolineales bacterium]